MSAANKTTVAVFSGSARKVITQEIYQYAQGQVLQFDGLDLPDSFRVDFSNEKDRDISKPQIGSDGGVSIPDEFLLSGKDVYAFVVLSEDEDDAATEYMVHIPVRRRPKPTNYAPSEVQQSVIDQTIAAAQAAQAAAEDAQAAAETAADEAEAAEQAVEDLGVAATTLAAGSAATVTKTLDPETGALIFTFGIPQGIQGDKGDKGNKGDTGNGISSAVLNQDYTLTLNFTDGTSYTTGVIRGAVGNGIENITKTGTSGNVDTYTITFTDGNTTTFTVNNGPVQSVAGKTGAVTLDAGDVAYDESVTYDDGTIGAALDELKNVLSHLDDIPGTVQTVNFGSDGKPSSIVHTKNGAAVRTDTFVWGTNTVTETRTLADGSFITFVTDLTTLVTTISEIQEGT